MFHKKLQQRVGYLSKRIDNVEIDAASLRIALSSGSKQINAKPGITVLDRLIALEKYLGIEYDPSSRYNKKS